MEERTSTYTYTPLDASKRQVRLLHLLPVLAQERSSHKLTDGNTTAELAISGIDEDNSSQLDVDYMADIRCTFTVASLDDDLDYEALSYVWGDQADRIQIYLHESPVSITKNLYNALVHMRRRSARVLWVDALCINQADMDERAAQVLLMGTIFGQASGVVVYLGTWDNADVGFRTIKAIGLNPSNIHQDTATMASQFQSVGLELDPSVVSEHLTEFFSLSWWSRIWTVQEYAFARKVTFQSGYHLLSNNSLNDMLDTFYGHNSNYCGGAGAKNSWLLRVSTTLAPAVGKGHLMSQFRDAEARRLLGSLLIVTMLNDRYCSDERDRIYGVLGLVDASFGSQVLLDYNLPLRTVYTSATIAWISTSRTLDVLSFIQRDESSDLPTYVLDLAAKFYASGQYYPGRNETMLPSYGASKTSTSRMVLLPSLTASTYAIFIDSVHINVDDGIAEHWASEGGSQSVVADPSPLLTKYSSSNDACWQTLCGGLMPPKDLFELFQSVLMNPRDPWKVARYRPARESDYGTFIKWQAQDDFSTLPYEDEVINFNASYNMATYRRYFAVTRTGYLGLVPDDARRGDCIVLMPGGKVPYVLRPVGSLGRMKGDGLTDCGRYEFVGDCYVHGIMYGEAWDESNLQEIILV